MVLTIMLQAGILAVEGLAAAWHATRIHDSIVEKTKMAALVSSPIEASKLSPTSLDWACQDVRISRWSNANF